MSELNMTQAELEKGIKEKQNKPLVEEQDISRLKGSQRVRRRPAVIFGSNDIKGARHTLYELVSNSIDEIRKGYGSKVEIIKHDDKSISIKDDGRGIPLLYNDKEEAYNWQLVFNTMYAGGNYNADSTALGLNGLGATGSVYASEIFQATSFDKKYAHTVDFREGRPIDAKSGEFFCTDDEIMLSKVEGARALSKTPNEHNEVGTSLTYRPDSKIFTDIDIEFDWISEKLKKQAIVNKGLVIDIKDESIENPQQITYCYENGIVDFLEELNNGQEITPVHVISANGTGRDTPDTPEYNYEYELGFCFNNNTTAKHYFHNSSELLQGGSTAEAIENAFIYAIDKVLKDKKLYKAKEKKIKFIDIEDSLIVIISSFSNMASFSDQTKLAINNKFIKDFTIESIRHELEVYFIETPIEANKIMNQVLVNKRSRESAEVTRLNVKKKLQKKSGNSLEKPDGFVDCLTKDKTKKEIYIAEGLSALGALVAGRDAKYQAITHVRGKMLSCVKADLKKIFDNAVVIRTLQLLGCGIEVEGKKNKDLNNFNIDDLQWDKIIIATDADVDGFQIRCLILAMIYRLMPTLIIKGKVYIAESPLFEIECGIETHYAYSETERDEICASLTGKVKVSRNKGLGEVEPEVISETMMHPDTRKLTQITVADIDAMHDMLDLWLGDDASRRYKALCEHFDEIGHGEFVTSFSKTTDITQAVNNNYLPYAVNVVRERALVEIDGYKPSHRKLLWTMHKMNLKPTTKTKSANIVGQTMKYNPHGDMAIYDTMVRLAQKDTLLYPFIKGKGNFGQHTSRDIQAAASRYTEATVSEIGASIFHDIDKNAVEMIPNYDNTLVEPVLLPTTFPNILVSQNEGIAVGMASNIPSFNMKEVCETTIAYIHAEDKEAFDVSETLIAPDFATGGSLLYDRNEMRKIYETGKGSVKLRANYTYNEKKNIIRVTEIPFTTNRETIVDKTIDAIKSNKIKEISNITDTTDLKGMSITIELKRGVNPEQVMAKLYKYTPMQTPYPCNMNILCLDNLPRVLGIKGILDEWITFRTSCVTRSTQYNLDSRKQELHRLYGIKKVLVDLDALIDIIRNSEDDELDSLVMKRFDVDEEQAKSVVATRLRKINKTHFTKRIEAISTLENEVKMYQTLLDDESLVHRVIIAQLNTCIEKFGQERRTQIKAIDDIKIKIDKVDTVENFNCTVFTTKEGYIKKIPATSLRGAADHKLKDSDEIIGQFDVTNKGELLVFTETGDCYKKVLHEIDSHKTSSLGEYIPSFLGIKEKIVYVCATTTFKETLMFGFENGFVAKTNMSAYKTKTKRTKIVGAFNMESPLVNTVMNTEEDVIMVADSGKVLVADQSKLNAKGKAGKGFKGIKVDDDQKMVLFDNLSMIKGLEDTDYYKYAFNRKGNLLKKTDTLPIDIK